MFEQQVSSALGRGYYADSGILTRGRTKNATKASAVKDTTATALAAEFCGCGRWIIQEPATAYLEQ
jgi:hypothetical protein